MYTIIGLAFCILLGVSIKTCGTGALLRFPAGFLVALFVAAQVILPIILGVPSGIRLVSRREMRAAVIGRILLTPLIWLFVLSILLFVVGFFWPSAAEFLHSNAALNLGMCVGTMAILLSPLSPKARDDFRADFGRSYQRFYTSQPASTTDSVSNEPPKPDLGKDAGEHYQRIVSAFIDMMADHRPAIGDASLLPYPKKKILYAIAWVRAELQEKSHATTNESVREKCSDNINTLNFLLTRLAHDWQTITPTTRTRSQSSRNSTRFQAGLCR